MGYKSIIRLFLRKKNIKRKFSHTSRMRKLFLFFTICLFCLTAPKVAVASAKVCVVGEKGVYEFCLSHLTTCTDVEKFLQSVERAEYVAPKNATLSFGLSPTVTNQRSGKAVDSPKLAQLLYDALSVGGGAVRVPFVEIKASLTADMIADCTFLRATFTTKFSSSKERMENIKLATMLINGTCVLNDQTFSFNNVVGKRTTKRGFKKAGVIENGAFTLGVGGGVCQVSSTLYNCALLAGLTPKEHHQHSLAVSYVEQSFDAMVADGYADLKFKNETGGAVFIFGKVSPTSVTFYVFGKQPNCTYKRQSVILQTYAPKTTEIITKELAVGQQKIVSEPKTGFKSEGYLLKYSGDVLLEKTKLRTDVYMSVDKIIHIGGEQLDNKNQTA